MSNTINQSVHISPLASIKIIAHGLRNPYLPIHGILVGKFTYESSDQVQIMQLSIEDVFPVCHSNLTKPIVDMSIRFARASIHSLPHKSTGERTIVGWYTSNERWDDETPGQGALKVVSALSRDMEDTEEEKCRKEPILITLSMKGLDTFLKGDTNTFYKVDSTLKVYGQDAKKHWLREYPTASVNGLLKPSLLLALGEGNVELFDFENHLEGGVRNVHETDWISNSQVKTFLQNHS